MERLRKNKKIFKADRKKGWATTFNLGQMHGGLHNNQVPSQAEMYLDIRYTEEKQRKKILEKIAAITPHVEVLLDFPPFLQDGTNPFVKTFKKMVDHRMNGKAEFCRESGASDARFFSHYGIPAIVTGILKKNIHAENEWASIHELQVFYFILKDFVSGYQSR